MSRNVALWAFLFAVVMLALRPASACFIHAPTVSQPMQATLNQVSVEITDQVAAKSFDCTFRNPNAQEVVGGECFMELEPGARITNMTVIVDGKPVKAEILDVRRASEVFNKIVKDGGSPALLEYYGNQLIRTKVPRIAAGGTVRVQFHYTTVLTKTAGVVRLALPSTNPPANMETLQAASVRVAIKSQEPIKNVYSPTHQINFVEEPDWDIVVKWSAENHTPTSAFVLYYQLAKDKIGATLLAHREPAEEGHFMLLVSPTVGGDGTMKAEDILPKDIVFCIDSSGSMNRDGKWEQARASLEQCLAELRPGDRFNVVNFGTLVESLAPEGLLEFSDATRNSALEYIAKLEPRGGTAIDDALATSLKLFPSSDRLKMILFATDGRPTVGKLEADAILKKVDLANDKNVRLHVIGEGHDVDTKLLDLLAAKHRGEAEYVLPSENIATKVGKFFTRIGSPVMTDVQVFFEDLMTHDVLPLSVPDLVYGEQIIVYGRYEGGGVKTVRLRGRVNGEYKTFDYSLAFPDQQTDERHAFVPRLWASERVDFLFDEMRTKGESQEWITEITRLAKRYGIVTPYTSFLLVEATCNVPLAQQTAEFKKRLYDDGNVLGRTYGARAVDYAWQQSRNKANRKESGNAAAINEQIADALKQEGREVADAEAPAQQQAQQALRCVGNRTFYNASGRWYDSRYDETQADKVQTIVVGSEECSNLLKTAPALAKYISQGDVVVEHEGNWYRFEPQKKG